MHIDDHLIDILYKLLQGDDLSVEENQTLKAWKDISDENRLFLESMETKEGLILELKKLHHYDTRVNWEKFKNQHKEPQKGRTPVRRLVRWRYLLAAGILLAVSLTGIFLFRSLHKWKVAVPLPSDRAGLFHSDLPPGSDSAILTLADGSQVTLTNRGQEAIGKQGSSEVTNKNGQVIYASQELLKGNDAVSFNTLSTPVGGQYRLTLPDGTRVWLNAASSLRYPTSFDKKNRTVYLKGEGYFEVNHEKELPFVVSVNEVLRVDVLGTRFNINAYSDEQEIRTTLTQGIVQLNAGAHRLQLKPAQQGRLMQGDHFTTVTGIDTEETVAWTQGLFKFKNATMPEIMRQVNRWYNVEVVFEEDIPDLFVATIGRNVPLSHLLKLLENTGLVHFKLTGNKITVIR